MTTQAHPGALAPYSHTPTDYVLYHRGNGYVACPARGLDYLGTVYTREEIDRAVVLGADVTFYATPPAVKIGGIPTWLAAVLGVAGAVGIGYFASRR